MRVILHSLRIWICYPSGGGEVAFDLFPDMRVRRSDPFLCHQVLVVADVHDLMPEHDHGD